MQAQYSERIHNLLVNGPSVGDLLELCEENYRCLHSLAPQLKRLQGKHCSSRPDHQDLHLTILEQTPYTTLLRLTYEFPNDDGGLSDPDVLLRVYHDARQVEVEDLRQQNLPTRRLYEAPGLMNKWRLNLFVSKWLAFCVRQGHLFVDDVAALRQPACDMS
ncbi:MAG: DUF1249 domain-containing protein [Gammaproteobacteria bacterium]|jgi:uncharacterized protein YqiB (DUF1249 family)|nr:DUF1249 domain-containing protein [Gammaproteobacteria bacterium]